MLASQATQLVSGRMHIWTQATDFRPGAPNTPPHCLVGLDSLAFLRDSGMLWRPLDSPAGSALSIPDQTLASSWLDFPGWANSFQFFLSLSSHTFSSRSLWPVYTKRTCVCSFCKILRNVWTQGRMWGPSKRLLNIMRPDCTLSAWVDPGSALGLPCGHILCFGATPSSAGTRGDSPRDRVHLTPPEKRLPWTQNFPQMTHLAFLVAP